MEQNSDFASFYGDESEFCITKSKVPLPDHPILTLYDVDKWFQYSTIKRTNLDFLPKRSSYHVVSVSFFRANVDNNKSEHEETSMAFDTWENKYWHGLKRLISQIHRINSSNVKSIPWVLRIYISKQLADEGYTEKIFLELLKNTSVPIELYTMSSFSIGAQPGMLWRFLAFSDPLINLCVVVDIDDDGLSEFKLRRILAFETSKHSLFGRYIGRGGVDGCFRICKETNAKNYPAVLGSFVLFKPRQASLTDIDNVMTKFVYQMIKRSEDLYSLPPSIRKLSPYDQSVHSHIYGWGGHWTMYGFDERFLKHVLLHYYAKQGSVLSFIQNEAKHLYEVSVDCKYVQSKHPNNVFLLV